MHAARMTKWYSLKCVLCGIVIIYTIRLLCSLLTAFQIYNRTIIFVTISYSYLELSLKCTSWATLLVPQPSIINILLHLMNIPLLWDCVSQGNHNDIEKVLSTWLPLGEQKRTTPIGIRKWVGKKNTRGLLSTQRTKVPQEILEQQRWSSQEKTGGPVPNSQSWNHIYK